VFGMVVVGMVVFGMVVVAPGERAGAADDLWKGVIQWE